MCDTNTINVTFYLLKVLHALKKSMFIVELSKNLRVGTLFNPIIFYIFYLIILKNIYLRVGTCPPWPYARSAHDNT
jgi:hypothetical protein